MIDKTRNNETTPDLNLLFGCRCATSGNIANAGNYPVDVDNYTTDSDDATEFVDAAGGDYRIKYGSAVWGKGYGAGDGPATIVG